MIYALPCSAPSIYLMITIEYRQLIFQRTTLESPCGNLLDRVAYRVYRIHGYLGYGYRERERPHTHAAPGPGRDSLSPTSTAPRGRAHAGACSSLPPVCAASVVCVTRCGGGDIIYRTLVDAKRYDTRPIGSTYSLWLSPQREAFRNYEAFSPRQEAPLPPQRRRPRPLSRGAPSCGRARAYRPLV